MKRDNRCDDTASPGGGLAAALSGRRKVVLQIEADVGINRIL